jgi:hypothetical protein
MSRSMPPGWLKCSSASFISLGIFQLLVFSFVDGVAPVMLGRIAQSIVICQSVFLDLSCNETLCCVAVFPLRMPWTDTCVWVVDNFMRCTELCYEVRLGVTLEQSSAWNVLTRFILDFNSGCWNQSIIFGFAFPSTGSVNICSCGIPCSCRQVVCSGPLVICCLILFVCV